MNMQEYLRNRVSFPLDELSKHRGEWVAWSPDGRRVVAASRDPNALDDLVRAAGDDPENCPIVGGNGDIVLWDVELDVDGPLGRARVSFEMVAGEPPPRWLEMWPWFTWPAVVVALFGIHQVLVRRKIR